MKTKATSKTMMLLFLASISMVWLTQPVFADQNIEVTPLMYDFGDVQVGTSTTTVVTIMNTDGHTLMIDSIALQTGSSPDFSVSNCPVLPVYIDASSVHVEITFSPSAVDSYSAVLKISSNDPDEPVVQVSLSGVGVSEEPPPPTSIAEILSFIDASVAGGTLSGDGPGKSAEGRLKALRNMIEAAGDLIDKGDIDGACQQLFDAYLRTDGLPRPPDFAAGSAAPMLAGMIMDLLTSLGW